MRRLLTLAALLLACLLVLVACGRTADTEEAPAAPAAEEDMAMELAAPIPYEFGTLPGGGSGEVARYPLSDLVQYRALDEYHQPAFMDAFVADGTLPPVEERLPPEPMVIPSAGMSDGQGVYGGVWRDFSAVQTEGWNLCARETQGWFGINYIYSEALVDSAPVFMRADDFAPFPNLAKSWEWSEDGMQLTMTLMEGVKWSDGAPFTMEDIRFTWEDNILDPNVPSWKTPTSWEIDGTPVTIDFHDDYTFTWNFPVPFPVQKIFDMDFLDFTICPAHVLKPHHPAHGGVDYEAYETSLPPLDLPPVSLGPWVAVEYKTDEFMVMRRNPYYWKVDEAGNQLPYMNEVTFQKGESGIGRTLGTLGGSIDHTNLENPSTYIETTKRQQEEDAHFYVAWGPEALGFPIEFNLSLSHGVENERDQALRELFRDVRFRKAVAYALDRDGIAQSVVRGPFLRGFPGGIAPGAVEFNIDSVVNYPYSPESASILLTELGFEDTNGDGILNWTTGLLEGEELIIGLNTSEDAAATQGVGEAASALLRDVGVEINMRVMQGPALGDANTNGTWEMRVTRTGQHYLTPFTRCTDLGPVTKEYGPHREGTEPRVLLDFEQELIDIINAFCLEPDQAKRGELMSRYNELFTGNVYHAGTIIGRYGLAMAKRFKNIPTGAPPFFVHWTWGNVRPEQMWIAEEDQDLVPEIRPGEIPVYN